MAFLLLLLLSLSAAVVGRRESIVSSLGGVGDRAALLPSDGTFLPKNCSGVMLASIMEIFNEVAAVDNCLSIMDMPSARGRLLASGCSAECSASLQRRVSLPWTYFECLGAFQRHRGAAAARRAAYARRRPRFCLFAATAPSPARRALIFYALPPVHSARRPLSPAPRLPPAARARSLSPAHTLSASAPTTLSPLQRTSSSRRRARSS